MIEETQIPISIGIYTSLKNLPTIANLPPVLLSAVSY
jgi:hypothetical protein